MGQIADVLTALGGNIGDILDQLAPDACVLLTPTETTDERGGTSSDPANYEPLTNYNIPCLIEPQGGSGGSFGREVVLGDRARSNTSYVATLPAIYRGKSVVATASRKLLVRARPGLGERTMEIKAVEQSTGVIIQLLVALQED